MKKIITASILSACMTGLMPATTASAHHSAEAAFNVEKEVEFKGVLTKVEWINPHTEMDFDVKGDDGKLTPWVVEFSGVAGLRAAGLGAKMAQALMVGVSYALVVNPSRDGRPFGLIKTLTFPNGRVFSLGSAAADGPRAAPPGRR